MRGANFAAPGHHLYQRLTIGRRPFSFPAVPNRAFNATRRSFEGIGRQVHMAHTTSTIDGYISLNASHVNQIMKVLTIVTVIIVP